MITYAQLRKIELQDYVERARAIIQAFDRDAHGNRSPRYQDPTYNVRLTEVVYHEERLAEIQGVRPS
jgi:hypothetical protein